MEVLTILFSSLITLVSPVGIVVDRVAETTIRKQFVSVEQLRVRVDSAPSYQIAQGKADRIRIAGRGLFPVQEVRLEALELETDPIHLNLRRRKGQSRLKQPLRAAVKLVIKQADVDRAVKSPIVANWLRKSGTGLVLNRREARRAQRYQFFNPKIQFLDDRRIQFQITLKEPKDPATLEIAAETGIQIIAGRQIRLITPTAKVNGDRVPQEIMQSIADGVWERLDLRQLESEGVIARVLQFEMGRDRMELATFVQIAPSPRF
jgi:hypothetical protein